LVWVNITVYAKDLPLVHTGQQVSILADGIPEKASGKITYLGPVVGENTRTALARVVLPNPDGHWRPGLFVTASIAIREQEGRVVVPTAALQTLEDKTVVFVKEHGVFKARPVTVGRRNGKLVEIADGLKPGEHYVTEGAFTLKAQLMKESFGEGHAH
jgi:cobalt-zinc-cadmium efflux system membrane fusion protein